MLLLSIFTFLFIIMVVYIMYANWPAAASGISCGGQGCGRCDSCGKPPCNRCGMAMRQCRCPKSNCQFC